MNRIREIRKAKNISQAKIATMLDTTPQSISLYEKGQREPKLDTWEKLADILQVPTPYLMGVSDDPNGWELWEKNTGYSKNELTAEIDYLISTRHLTGNEPLYDQINKAVTILNEDGESDIGVKRFVDSQLLHLTNEVTIKYQDPKKVANLPSDISNRTKTEIKSTFYDDMNPATYKQIQNVLSNARKEISSITISKKK
ncbi:helix-turn-helix domain-containing protein [Companilactobacillus sp. HBUAS59699]|uniref:helix-turn-helix domain-containing protein n=1 Tax=Companilactobacillus sp. HBUAS59699 TaxID=3109358 RepID=UPI002FF09129